jgi:hypothetical protein
LKSLIQTIALATRPFKAPRCTVLLLQSSVCRVELSLFVLVVCTAVLLLLLLSNQVVESRKSVLRKRMSSPTSASQLPGHDFTSANFNGLFIGISGLIGAGKSTLATALDRTGQDYEDSEARQEVV